MGKFKKVKMKEGKVSLIVTKEGELQCDRRLKKKKKKDPWGGLKNCWLLQVLL